MKKLTKRTKMVIGGVTGAVVIAGVGGAVYLSSNGSKNETTTSSSKTVSLTSAQIILRAKSSSETAGKASSEATSATSSTATTATTGSMLMVVNKKHPLPSDYNPYNGGLSPETTTAKNELIAAMREAGFSVSDNVSGYRSFAYQTTLYNGYVSTDGQAQADAMSARPGYSEHQSGLAFDLLDGNGQLFAENNSNPTGEKWLLDNAWKYGLIVRFPEGKTAITGYENEEWHMRYVGKTAAKAIHDSGETLEEYTGVSGGDYNSSASDDVPALDEKIKQ